MQRAINSQQFAEQLVQRAIDMYEHPEQYKGWSSGVTDLDRKIGGILR